VACVRLRFGFLRVSRVSYLERLTVQFRAEAFNVTNTPHFGNPGNNFAPVIYNPNGSIQNLTGFSQINSLAPLRGSSAQGTCVSVFGSVFDR